MEQFLPYLLGIGGFILLFIAICAIYLDGFKNGYQERKEEETTSRYSQEEILLAEFLEDKQTINEAYLSAQSQLLKNFRDS